MDYLPNVGKEYEFLILSRDSANCVDSRKWQGI